MTSCTLIRSSAAIVAWWCSVSLVLEAATIRIDSDTGQLLVDEVDAQGVFRGASYVSEVGSGLSRFFFLGDVVFAADDAVVGVGARAISFTVSGNVVLPEGATFDFSARGAGPGPGGGLAGESGASPGGGSGGVGGNGGSGGTGGAGSAAGVGEGGGRGNNGTTGTTGDGGGLGASGPRGEDGGAGYRAPDSGGVGGAGGATGGGGGFFGQQNADHVGGGGAGGGPHGATGGTGGSASKRDPNTDFGGPGGAGQAGNPGQPGKAVRDISLLTGGGAGGTGGSGRAGGGGAGGHGGSGGGGGGGGGFDLFTGGRRGSTGQGGGKGGEGGRGADGGLGGRGGHGGGALEIIAMGRISGGALFVAKGGAGESGEATRNGAAGGVVAFTSATTPANTGSGFTGGKGGAGTRGGPGGAGGAGGAGGGGGGGAGGTIRLVASVSDFAGLEGSVAGGSGESAGTEGEIGRFVLGTNTGTGSTTADPGSLEVYHGLRAYNPHVSASEETPLIPDLVGGAEVAGLLNGFNAGSFADVLAGAPANARLATHRLAAVPGSETVFSGFDVVLLINLTGEALPRPFLGIGTFGYSSQLIAGGVETAPEFGGAGPVELETLEAWGVYLTLAPSMADNAGQGVRFGFTPDITRVSEAALDLAVGTSAYLRWGAAVDRSSIPAAVVRPDPSFELLGTLGAKTGFDLSGALQVHLSPDLPVSDPGYDWAVDRLRQAGAGWALRGWTPTYPSGTAVEGLPTGPGNLRFARVPGWLPPADQVISIKPGRAGAATLDFVYTEAKTVTVGEIAPQESRAGLPVGFWVEDAVSVHLVRGSYGGSLSLSPDGWFSYEPGTLDRAPFTLRFTSSTGAQDVVVSPLPNLPPEQSVIALRPTGATLPDPTGRDYILLHEGPGERSVNFFEIGQTKAVTIAAHKAVFSLDDPLLYDAVHDRKNVEALNIYADEVVIGAPLHLPQVNVTIYARIVRFEDGEDGTALIDTTPVGHTVVNASDEPLDGGDITLYVREIVADSSPEVRFILGGGQTYSSAKQAGDSGLLASPFAEIGDLAMVVGGRGAGARGRTRSPVVLPDEGLGTGYHWLHPMAIRQTLLYAKELYFLGFIFEAGELLTEYKDLLGEVYPLPDGLTLELPDSGYPDLEFAELFSELAGLVDRISDKLDYFGNSAGWVPLLSFESNFQLTESAIRPAMNSLYLSHWIQAATATLETRRAALQQARSSLGDENDALRAEFPRLQDEIVDLNDQADSLDVQIKEIQAELGRIEDRLLRKAEEIVEQRNNVPWWKKALRGASVVLQMVPVGQPALSSVGSGLELSSRIDEQDPLVTLVEAGSIAAAYKGADYDKKAQDIDDELNPPAPKNEKEIERDELRSKSGKLAAAASGLATGADFLREQLAAKEVPQGEIDQEIAKLRAADPQLAAVADTLETFLEQKWIFVQRVASLENRLREIPIIILKNRIAMLEIGDSIAVNNGALDPQVLSVVNEMTARTKERLRLYFYQLAKSFEYRLLEPFRADGELSYDPVSVFSKVEAILIAAESGGTSDVDAEKPFVLSAAGYQALAALFEGELTKLTDRIVNSFEAGDGPLESSSVQEIVLISSQLAGIDTESGALLNLHDDLYLQPNNEAQRIAGLVVTDVDYRIFRDGVEVDPATSGLSSAVIDVEFAHSGVSRLRRRGETYVFNHYRDGDPAKSPTTWTGSVNLLTGEINPTVPALATEALLATILGGGKKLSLNNFSRPGAWADLYIRAKNLSVRAGSGFAFGYQVRIDRIVVQATIDFLPKHATREIDIRVLDQDGEPLAITPRFRFDSEAGAALQDRAGRGDANGEALRSFDDSTVVVTADDFFGSPIADAASALMGYQLASWRLISGSSLTLIDGTGDDRLLDAADPTRMRIRNQGVKRFLAVYQRVGDSQPPSVIGISSAGPGSSPGEAVFEIEFDEDVVGVTRESFALNDGPGGVGIVEVSGSGTKRLVRIASSEGSRVALRFLDASSVLDVAGNSVGGPGGQGGFTSEAVLIGQPPRARLALSAFDEVSVRLVLLGDPGQQWAVEVSEDLMDWTRLASVTLLDEETFYVDENGVDVMPRFYRLVHVSGQ